MKPETKIVLRRFALRWLRKLVDLADDRLHTAEVRFREEMQVSPVRENGDTAEAEKIETEAVIRPPRQLDGRPRKKRQRGMSASAFDIRFSSSVLTGVPEKWR
jgi:hypothetical protein